MLYSSSANNKPSQGFTLVEVLVITPVIIIVIGIIIAFMVSMTGDALQSRERNKLIYDLKTAADQIESDILVSNQVLSTTGTLPSQQGSNLNFTGTQAFTSSSNTLVLQQNSTSGSPYDVSRSLLYYQDEPNPCDSSMLLNDIVNHTVVYFLDNGNLTRRTIVDFDGPVCGIGTNLNSPNIWQHNTCKITNTARCFDTDTIVARNIQSVNFQYYRTTRTTLPVIGDSANTRSIRVTLNGRVNAAGATIDQPMIIRTNLLNL